MLTLDRVGPAVAGTVVAGIVGYFAIIWLTRVVRSGRIWWFSLYLIVLAIVVLSTRGIALSCGAAHLVEASCSRA